MTVPLSPRLRLCIWITLVLILLPFHLVSLRIPIPSTHPLLTTSILGLALLLHTTPPTAIRLRVRTSRWTLLTGTTLLQAFAYTSPPHILRALLLLLATWILINLLIRAGLSPWWSVLACWNPITTFLISTLSTPLALIDMLIFSVPAFVLWRARST